MLAYSIVVFLLVNVHFLSFAVNNFNYYNHHCCLMYHWYEPSTPTDKLRLMSKFAPQAFIWYTYYNVSAIQTLNFTNTISHIRQIVLCRWILLVIRQITSIRNQNLVPLVAHSIDKWEYLKIIIMYLLLNVANWRRFLSST